MPCSRRISTRVSKVCEVAGVELVEVAGRQVVESDVEALVGLPVAWADRPHVRLDGHQQHRVEALVAAAWPRRPAPGRRWPARAEPMRCRRSAARARRRRAPGCGRRATSARNRGGRTGQGRRTRRRRPMRRTARPARDRRRSSRCRQVQRPGRVGANRIRQVSPPSQNAGRRKVISVRRPEVRPHLDRAVRVGVRPGCGERQFDLPPGTRGRNRRRRCGHRSVPFAPLSSEATGSSLAGRNRQAKACRPDPTVTSAQLGSGQPDHGRGAGRHQHGDGQPVRRPGPADFGTCRKGFREPPTPMSVRRPAAALTRIRR